MDLRPLIVVVEQAMALCQHIQNQSVQSTKKQASYATDSEPVTIADYGAQALIGRVLSEHFPDDGVFSEEAGEQFLELTTPEQQERILTLLGQVLSQPVQHEDIIKWLDHGTKSTSSRMWVIDPIDGTKGFINNRHYAIGIGYIEDGKIAGSVVGVPKYGDMGTIFFAKDGEAFKKNLATHEVLPIRVSERRDDARIVQSFEKKHASKSRMAIVRENAGLSDAPIIELDSMEKYALVACGDAEAYLRLPNINNTRPHMIWDHAPGAALVLAAGGMVTDVDGSPLNFAHGKTLPNRGMLVSNGLFHDRLVAATQELLEEEASQKEDS